MIPRIIHQTWRDTDIPEALLAYAGTWRRHHPDWTYRLWTDADLAELVENRFPELAESFHAYPQPIMRADLGRYLVLKAEGGVYADLDAEALRPWDDLTAAERPVFFEEPPSHMAREFVQRRGFAHIVSNAVMASPTDHPFWDHLIPLLAMCRNARNPLDATGPFVLTAAVDRAPAAIAPEVRAARLAAGKDNCGAPLPLPAASEAEKPLADHHWAGTWWRNRQDWPPGASDAAPHALRWHQRPRERAACQRLAASVAAARTFSSDTPSPRGERVLIAVPIHDAAPSLDAFIEALGGLDHPGRSLSIAFLDCHRANGNISRLRTFARTRAGRYAGISIQRQRFRFPGSAPPQAPPDRRTQGAGLARLKNRLLRRSLGDEDWVLWLEPDAVAFPPDLIRSLIAAGTRVVQPNAVVAPAGPTADPRSWLAEYTLDDDSMRSYRRDGLYLPPVGYGRLYPSDLRYRDVVPLDSVGGKALLVDANLHRAGILFPETPYRHLIDTEGFGAILRDNGIAIAGLPQLEVIVGDTPPAAQ